MKEMKVLYVGVDNLPDSCSDCRMTQWSTEGKRMYCFCVVRDEMVNLIKYPNSRPLNCPLKLKSDKDKLKIDVDDANVYEKGKANIGYDLRDHYGRCFYDNELFATEDEAEFECIRLNEILEREKRGE